MNWRILFSGTQSTVWTVSVTLVVLLTLVLCVWLSRIERRLVSAAVGRLLMILRLTILATLLLTLLQPVLTRHWDPDQRGRVILGIDASESMQTQDRHATDAEKLRWAQALGMLGNQQTRLLIDEWVTALEAGREPDWLGSGAPPNSPAEAQMADSRQQQVAAVLSEVGQITRLEFIRRLLQAQPQPLLKQLGDVMPLDIRIFATQQQAVLPDQLDSLLQGTARSVQPSATDAVQFFNSVLTEESSSPVRGVVLLSDGRQTAAGDPAAEARRLGVLKVPIFTVPVGSRLPPRDLSLAAIEAPESVFLNDKAQIAATIGTSGFEGQELSIQLQQDGEVIDQQTVTPAGDSAAVRFEIPASAVGRHDYRVAVAVQPGELREDNNSRDLSLQVVDNKVRVLLADGDARWEFRYLRNLLERDKQTDLFSVMFRQPSLQLLDESFINRSLPSAESLKERLATTDILIVGDVEPADFSEAVWTQIEQAVTNEGLTLLVIPGRRSMPHGFASKTLSALLPVENFQQRLAERYSASNPDQDQSAFNLTPTPEAEQLPMFQPEPGLQPSLSTGFSQLPGHPWLYTAMARPSAVVWAVASHAGNPTLQEPIIVHQYYGFGQVIWMGVDSTWRWRRRAGDTWHHRFWGQLIRWSARNKSAAGNDQVRFTLSDIIVDENAAVSVSARFSDQALQQLNGATVEAVIQPALVVPPDNRNRQASGQSEVSPDSTQPTAESDSQGRVILLQSADDHPNRFAGQLPGLSPGNWVVQLRVRGGQLQLKERVASDLLVRPRLSAELANISCHRDLLQQIAQLSGGQMIEPSDLSRLAELIEPQSKSDSRLEEHTLWDHWAALLLFFGLLTTEWITRKLNGLP